MSYAHGFTTFAHTQRVLERFGFAPTVFERQKIRDIFGSGREGGMFLFDTNSTPEDVRKEVYVPDSRENVSEVVMRNVQALEDDDTEIERYLRNVDEEIDLEVELERDVLDEEANHRIYTAMPGGEKGREETMEMLERSLEERDYVEVQVAANLPETAGLSHYMEERGFDFAGFIPNWIDADDTTYDALVWNNSPPEERTIQVTESSLDLIRKLDLREDLEERISLHDEIGGVYHLTI